MWDNSPETKYWGDWAEERKFTIVACFGNHENYTAIRSLPTEEWHGGVVRKVRPHIMYLENGELYNIGGKTLFTLGGAASIDKHLRKEGVSWWPEEIPSTSEFEHAAETLQNANFKVDYILTHTAPCSIIERIDRFMPRYDIVTSFLEKYVLSQVNYKAWMCGHLHLDRDIPDKNFHFLYHDIIELRSDNTIDIVND